MLPTATEGLQWEFDDGTGVCRPTPLPSELLICKSTHELYGHSSLTGPKPSEVLNHRERLARLTDIVSFLEN